MTNAGKALNDFWNSFGVEAYDESTVPDNATIPRITYSYGMAEFGPTVALSASLWDRSYSWKTVSDLAEAIYERIGLGGTLLRYEGGVIWLRRGTPFAQRMSDEDDAIRRIYVNLEAEFLTAL